MEKIKKSVLILVLVNSFLYGADWSKLLYSSAAMEESNLEHSLNLGDLKQSKNWWVPSLTFNGAYYTGGDFSSQTVNNSLDSILKISQNIPGGLVLWGKVQVPLFVGEDWAKNLFPSIGVNIPVIPSLRGAKLYNSFINNQYTDYKNGADLDYKISLKKKAVIFSEYVWKVLYNRKKTESRETSPTPTTAGPRTAAGSSLRASGATDSTESRISATWMPMATRPSPSSCRRNPPDSIFIT